jgi:hypothetical protein
MDIAELFFGVAIKAEVAPLRHFPVTPYTPDSLPDDVPMKTFISTRRS